MKNVVLILLFILLNNGSKAQSVGVPDTLVYLQSIVTNKAQYIGRPFYVLYSGLQIQIKLFSPFSAIHHQKYKETSTSFSFYYPQDGLDDFYLTFPKLEIYWQAPLSSIQSDALWQAANGGSWSLTVYDFYKNAIIGDIRVRE